MRLKQARIAPLSDADMTPEQKDALGDRFRQGKIYNIFRTLARAPKAYKAFMRWGGYILSDHNSLGPREREIVILRAGVQLEIGL